MENNFFDQRVIVVTGDITEQRVEAIVTAANSTLLGVDDAIHQKGGARMFLKHQIFSVS